MMTTTYKRLLLFAALPALMLASCSREEMADVPGGPDTPDGAIRFEIDFIPQNEAMQTDTQTRVATDTKFNSTWEKGDEIGIFAVEHGTQLAASGNFIHNVKLTYNSANSTWSGPAYWPTAASGITALDFFAYYPYDATATDPTAITFNVKADQSATTNIGGTKKSNYNLSDLLTAKADNSGRGYTRGTTVSLAFSHALAMVQVKVNRVMVGNYAPDALHVWLSGCISECVLNLSTQSAAQPSAPASAAKIKMYACPNDDNAPGIYAYRALVPVQTIASGTAMFSFGYGGSTLFRSEPLAQPLSLAPGQAETSGMSFPYSLATVSSTVRLDNLFTDDELAAITHLRVFGEMATKDFSIIRDKMHALTDLDLSGATVKNDAIPKYALSGKTSLNKFVFPRNIRTIGSFAFSGCSGLTGSLTIPEGVTTIDNSAFSRCSGFNGSLTIPKSVTTIGGGAFYGCSSFTGSLTIPQSVTTISSSAFYGCSSFTGSLTIPEGVTIINSNAFMGCSGFNGSLTIPEGVTTIDISAFSHCSGFTGSLNIPEGVTTIGALAFYNCSGFDGSLTIPEGVVTIDENAFNGCSSFIGPLVIPEGMEKISSAAFMGCSSFTALTIPESVVTISASAFAECSGFKGSLIIPKGVETIGRQAFSGCRGFDGSLTIPEGVVTIDENAFNGCSGFTGSLIIPKSVKTIRKGAFVNCSSFTGSLIIPEGVDTINDTAFYNCSGFTALTIPESVMSIGYKAFSQCSGFKGLLTIPKGVVTISEGAFSGCSDFTGSLTIPKDVVTISENAFAGCSGFTGSLTIPESVKTIGNGSFAGCTGFNGSLTIPQGVTTIAHYAFRGCIKLSSITCHLPEPGKAAYGLDVFYEVPANIPVFVPKAAVKAFRNHSVWGRFTNIQAIP